MAARYFVYVPKSVLKSMAKIPLPWQHRIEKAIDAIQLNPRCGEKMSGNLSDKWKIRVWPYRIIYKIDEKKKAVFIFEAAHRGNMFYG